MLKEQMKLFENDKNLKWNLIADLVSKYGDDRHSNAIMLIRGEFAEMMAEIKPFSERFKEKHNIT